MLNEVKSREAGKTILVVGGTSGIGLETTKLLSRENKVIVISREKRNLDGLDNVEFYSADIAKSAEELPKSRIHRWNCLLPRHNKFKTLQKFED